jgi:hypothetical protein
MKKWHLVETMTIIREAWVDDIIFEKYNRYNDICFDSNNDSNYGSCRHEF